MEYFYLGFIHRIHVKNERIGGDIWLSCLFGFYADIYDELVKKHRVPS